MWDMCGPDQSFVYSRDGLGDDGHGKHAMYPGHEAGAHEGFSGCAMPGLLLHAKA